MLCLPINNGTKTNPFKEKKMLKNEKVGMEPELPNVCRNSLNL